ncbi:hypothetical protein MIB92_14145 [Aestuariirhabdus sp. Z084]|uniref:hypothetical protein n=1 Tax=Aestuariirhabdus haliotis TaxID=2918751 RepID=UPI00201B36AF|nr:hypothetical protein [Aestuariirhabdus haliotis]MCL6416798.1 hypothetical protein [Aestuariirhabdus haliotis]MCL6420798.1 hypothetical protein [Aestuariirhabdus haliotis]
MTKSYLLARPHIVPEQAKPRSVFLRVTLLLAALLAAPFHTTADEPTPVSATIESQGSGFFTISVTLKHADEGWEHYANRWEVLDGEGNILATRTLLHPHVNEQPFTRNLSAVRLPNSLDTIYIRAHDSKHGYGRRKIKLAVPE